MVRILIVDDHALVREGLASVLGDVADFEVVGTAGTAAEALSQAEALSPDVVVLDLRLPDRPGTAIVADLRTLVPAVRVVVLTSYGQERGVVVAAMAAGVDAFLTKSANTDALVDTIRTVLAGRAVFQGASADTLRQYVRATRAQDAPALSVLTPRELEVDLAVAEGLSNRQVGERLQVSEKTVKNHVSEILSKLGANRRSQIPLLIAPIAGDVLAEASTTTGRAP
jgi:DNA-binding NarL/FixJ family response regulator